MKFPRNDPFMVLFRISGKNLISEKNSGCHGNKTEKYWKSLELSCLEGMGYQIGHVALSGGS